MERLIGEIVRGLDYSEKLADEATLEILDLLKEKYKIWALPLDGWLANKEDRQGDLSKLNEAIRDFFKHRAWESF